MKIVHYALESRLSCNYTIALLADTHGKVRACVEIGFGRNVRLEEGGIFGDNGYVRSNGGRFVDIYDGNIENIQEEYRISSPTVPARSALPRQAEQPER